VTLLPDKRIVVAGTLRHSPAEDLIAVLRNPNHVILQIEDLVPATAVLHHIVILAAEG
jgi:hypothetical protein